MDIRQFYTVIFVIFTKSCYYVENIYRNEGIYVRCSFFDEF